MISVMELADVTNLSWSLLRCFDNTSGSLRSLAGTNMRVCNRFLVLVIGCIILILQTGYDKDVGMRAHANAVSLVPPSHFLPIQL